MCVIPQLIPQEKFVNSRAGPSRAPRPYSSAKEPHLLAAAAAAAATAAAAASAAAAAAASNPQQRPRVPPDCRPRPAAMDWSVVVVAAAGRRRDGLVRIALLGDHLRVDPATSHQLHTRERPDGMIISGRFMLVERRNTIMLQHNQQGRAITCVWFPLSTTRPCLSTTMLSASRIVDSRWAITT